MKIYMDVDTLNAKFWATALNYTDKDGNTVAVPEAQILVENGPAQEVDETAPYVRWEISPGASQRVTQGETRLFKNLGTAHLEVFVPKGVGTAVADEIRESLIAALADWRSDDKALRIYKHDAPKGKGSTSSHQLNAVFFYEAKREA